MGFLAISFLSMSKKLACYINPQPVEDRVEENEVDLNLPGRKELED
jgi:hypothetical protein